MNALKMVRNGVAAHHGVNRGKGMDKRIAWTLNDWKLTQSDTTPFGSQSAEYAVRPHRTIQTLGADARYTNASETSEIVGPEGLEPPTPWV